MASPQKTQKPVSRWGFLQQAVASVESRLDNILGEDDEIPRKSTPAPASAPQPAKDVSSNRGSADIPRNSTSSPANDRLQERLARAMVKKTGSRPESPMPQTDPISRTDTPNSLVASEEMPTWLPTSTEENERMATPLDRAAEPSNVVITRPLGDETEGMPKSGTTVTHSELSGLQLASALAVASSEIESARTSAELFRDSPSLSSSIRPSTDSQAKVDPAILQMQLEHEVTQSKVQEEINAYIERIDALQAKLQYLTKEAAQAAREASASAQAGSAEKKLLEKDEKIALLMEEGQKLSMSEMKHLTTIKKLRSQATTSNKENQAVRLRAEQAERSLRAMEDRARRAEAANKRAEQNLASSVSTTTDLEALVKERNALNITLADIRSQLTRANARADAAEGNAQSEQLEKERKRSADLQDDLTSAKVERELAEEKLIREIGDLKSSLEREKEHSRVMETEMLGEQAALESRLESFRARAEEASSGDHGETQAKLLRQIETLQSQYAAASQNWQGIEGTLLSRITNLEKERDDIASREGEVRKKLRDATLKIKDAERELEEIQNRHSETEKSQADAEAEVQRLNRKVQQLEDDLEKSRQDLDEQKVHAERELIRRLDDEKSKWTATLHTQKTESPGTSIRKGLGMGFDMNHMMTSTHYDRRDGRRPSVLPGHDSNTPPRQYSTTSIKNFTNGGVPETPSIITSNDDEYFVNAPPTPASQSHDASRRGLNDIISTSTVGAGPSVQLVERMSANVRRLESEKAATKDELARLTTQRDEARQEVVSLMRETEAKAKVDERLKALETEHQELAQRYQTTLELLGEKSEQVEELKADITDVKQMYRQLADTMK